MNILVTGLNGFIANNIRNFSFFPSDYSINFISLRDPEWKNKSFSKYDVIIHLAGVAHIKPNKRLQKSYYAINKDLTIEIAKKAKKDGVKQFIFMSSMIVYSSKLKLINYLTKPNPDNFYGKSKLYAENELLPLSEGNFIVSIVRSPMVYGLGNKGNLPKLIKIFKLLPFFPRISNRRSSIYIENLIFYFIQIINNKSPGYLYPQNKEYLSSLELYVMTRKIMNKPYFLTNIFNLPLKFLMFFIPSIRKIFGDFAFIPFNDNGISSSYQVYSFDESIKKTFFR